MHKVYNNDFFSDISDNDRIGFLLWKVNNFWQRTFKKKFKDLDITHSQLLLLMGVLWGESQNIDVTQKELSDKLGIDPMTTSTVLRTLQKKGLIIRKYNNKDTRTRLIYITEKGKIIVIKANKIIKIFNNSFFSCLKDNQKQFKEDLITLLLSDEDSKQDLLVHHQRDLEKLNINIEKQ